IKTREVDAVATAYYEISLAIKSVGKAHAWSEVDIVILYWLLRVTQRAPDEVHRVQKTIEVVQAGQILRRFTCGDESAEAVIAKSQVQNQVPIEAPVVLTVKRPAVHAPSIKIALLCVERNCLRGVVKNVRDAVEGHIGIGAVRRSSSTKIEL